jgi:hypothetical protein
MNVILAHVVSFDMPAPTIMQGDVYGHGMIELSDLKALLPEGATLRLGHYRINQEHTCAVYLGPELPEGLLK